MYEAHFGFHRQPFQSADASRAFFVSESIREILPQLLHALRSDLGIAVLTGVPGSGKTHLLKAASEALHAQGARVGWMDASSLQPPEFNASWAAVVMDECHLYTALQQQAAFNWFVNALNTADGQPRLVLAAGDLPPADLVLRDDLRSRLGWGHVFELHTLSEPERRAVLRVEADARGVFLSDEVIGFVLSRFSRDLSSLMQLLDRLDSYALQTQRAVTVPLIKAMLEST